MFYAFRTTPHQTTLTEFANRSEFLTEAERLHKIGNLNVIPAERARRWVKDGGHHETALYVNLDGQVRRAHSGSY